MVLPEAPLAGALSTEVRGIYEPSAALSLLLQGTGFEGSLRDGVIRLRRAAAPRSAPRDRRTRLRSRAPEPELRETVVVVGTNIRGLYPGAYPVDIYTADDIARTGAVRTEQFIDTLTQNLDTRTQFGPGSTAQPNYEGVNGIDLRGLGVGTSLVLLNGRRLPLASEGQTADLSMIPLSAVERIEVLTDGASAIYGSDAIGGVVNFVLKQGSHLPETRIDFGAVTDGGLRSGGVSHSFGRTWASGEVFVSASARRASALDRQDRDYAQMAGAGDLSPVDDRYALVATFSADVTQRTTLSGDVFSSLRRVKTRDEIPEAQVLVSNWAEIDNSFARLEADFRYNEDLRASATISYGERRDDVYWLAEAPGLVQVREPDTNHSSWDATAKLEGQMWDLPGGRVRFSIGAGRGEETFAAIETGHEMRRSADYAFAEILAPILTRANGVRFAQRLELSLAARYTNYDDQSETVGPGSTPTSDFGDRVNPKFGLLWSLTDWLSLRGSYSDSFRAPSLAELDPSNSVNAVNILPVRGVISTVLGVAGPSMRLRPETAEIRTAGFDLSAPFNPDLRVRATYFNISYDGRIAAPDPTSGVAALSDPDRFSDILFPTTSVALIEQLLRSTTNVANFSGVDLSDPAGAAAQFAAMPNFMLFDDRLRNLDEIRIDGFDLDLAYWQDFAWGELSLGGRFTYMADYEEKVFSSAPSQTLVDTVLRPVDLRGRAFAGVERERMSATLAVNYVDDYRNPHGVDDGRVASWTTWDARFEVDLARVRGSALFALNIYNIFDAAPPFSETSGRQGLALQAPIGFDPANANPTGRFVSLQLVKRW
jgi:outer membrane receptor protein involved in Fe transport